MNRGHQVDHPSRALAQLARLHGVHTRYVDAARQRQQVSPQALLAVLRSLGVPLERVTDAAEALRQSRRARVNRMLEPVHVVWRGMRGTIPLRLPERISAPLCCQWELEDGRTRRDHLPLKKLRVRRASVVDGVRYVTRDVPVPAYLPAGYHRLAFECDPDRFETLVFCAPERCFAPPESRRVWGMFAPLYALHSGGSWGAGDFNDLTEFMGWVAQQGGQFVGTLPLLPAFLDQPCEPSPYSPLSRLFWNEFYLDLERVPELETDIAARRRMLAPEFLARLRELRQAPLVDYATQMSLKRQVLEVLCRSFFARPSPRFSAFEQFSRDHPEVADYARFRAVHERRGRSWTEWPARLRNGELRDGDCRPSCRHYHLYIQWLAHEQMTRLSERARKQGVDLYLDMPLGVHRDGYDAWRYQTLFAREASGGAPPDPVFTQGQDWGFAPLHPERSREQGHAYIRAYVRHHLRHARMLRFDHVMGLHRLYWVPRGLPASEGAYVSYPAEELYAILTLESHRHRAVIVGENLGTVPAEVNRGLKRHGVGALYVVQYEARPQTSAALRPVPAHAVASLNTHDMPTFAAFWRELDLADRHRLRLIQRGDLAREHRLRYRIRQALAAFLRRRGWLDRGDAGAVFRATVAQLGSSAAQWVMLNLEDLWLETAPQNTPGTLTERVNWRRKARLSLEALREMPRSFEPLETLRRLRGPADRPQRFAEASLGVRPIDSGRSRRHDGVDDTDDPCPSRLRIR
jgi:4-alpha-glucanotransferase